MKQVIAGILFGVFVAPVWGEEPKKPAPKVPLGKDTTYVTGPLDADGYVNYEAALNERLDKGIRPESNAMVLVWKALGPTPFGRTHMPPGYFKRLGIDEPPATGDYFVDFETYLKDHVWFAGPVWEPIFKHQRLRAMQRPWTAKDLPVIDGWLEVNEKPLALFRQAAARAEYFNPLMAPADKKGPGGLVNACVPFFLHSYELQAALASRAMLRTAEGRMDEAWQDLLACHRLGRLFARGGTVSEWYAGTRFDRLASEGYIVVLANSKLTAKQIQEFVKAVRALAPLPPVGDKLDLTERFVILDAAQQMHRDGPLGYYDVIGVKQPRKVDDTERIALQKSDWAPGLRTMNAWQDRLVAATRLEVRAKRDAALEDCRRDIVDIKAEADEVDDKIDLKKVAAGPAIANCWCRRLLFWSAGTFHRLRNDQDRAEQIERNLHVAFALAAFRADNGRYPAKLGELVPKYLAAVPDDLFSGKALIYKPSPDGYLLYSVGPNGNDDGGRTIDDTPPGDDLAVRVPLPELKSKK
jgi:hypothetical protein